MYLHQMKKYIYVDVYLNIKIHYMNNVILLVRMHMHTYVSNQEKKYRIFLQDNVNKYYRYLSKHMRICIQTLQIFN